MKIEIERTPAIVKLELTEEEAKAIQAILNNACGISKLYGVDIHDLWQQLYLKLGRTAGKEKEIVNKFFE